MDETAAEPGALASGAADAVCLKIGALRRDLAACSREARRSCARRERDVYLASTFDGPLGIAAALHAAAALAADGRCRLRAGHARPRSRTSTTRSCCATAPGRSRTDPGSV